MWVYLLVGRTACDSGFRRWMDTLRKDHRGVNKAARSEVIAK